MNNKIKKIIGVVLIVLIVAVITFFIFFDKVKVDTNKISVIKIIDKHISNIQENIYEKDSIFVSGEFEDGSFTLDIKTSLKESSKDKKIDFKSDFEIDLKYKGSIFIPALDISGLEFSIDSSFVKEKLYIKLSVDEEDFLSKLNNSQLEGLVKLFAGEYINKYLLMDANKAPGAKVAIDSLFNKEELVAIIEKIKDYNEKVYSIKETGETKKINGDAAAEFKITFNTESILNIVESDKNFAIAEKDILKMLIEKLTQNISIWVTEDNVVRAFDYILNLDLDAFKKEDIFGKFGKFKIEINSEFENIDSFEVAEPTDALDLFPILFGSNILEFNN